jgi:hypothetical protein
MIFDSISESELSRPKWSKRVLAFLRFPSAPRATVSEERAVRLRPGVQKLFRRLKVNIRVVSPEAISYQSINPTGDWSLSMERESINGERQRIAEPIIAAQPVTEEEWHTMMFRLDSTRDIFRQNREMREVLSRREADNRALQTRNHELEEVIRKFAPMLMDVATKMGLAARDQSVSTRGLN